MVLPFGCLWQEVAKADELLEQHHCGQFVIISTPNWNAVKGKLQRYRYNPIKHDWQQVGKTVPVVVGKNGLAWGMLQPMPYRNIPNKHEGDGRTPAGIFEIGSAFGFGKRPNSIKLPYITLSNASICVDDEKSRYYNQLFDYTKSIKPDWHSCEQMRQVSEYHFGCIISYNTTRRIAGNGSCIFLHVWKKPNHGTAGCIAMAETDLKQLLAWLNPTQKPLIIVLPVSYQ